jgi:protein SCO1/2
VQNGFRLASQDDASNGEVLHSSKLVLVDGEGRIRGYYDGTDEKDVTQLMRDTKRLLHQTSF